MLIRIIIEVVLAIAMLYPAFMFWQLRKRKRFWKQAVRNRAFLQSLISRESLANPPSDLLPYVRTPPKEGGYMWNVKLLFDADKGATLRFSIFYGVVIAAILVGSYLLGPLFLAINVVLFFLAALVPISTAARSDASENIFTVGLILHRWHLDNAAECEQFVKQAYGLRTVYEAVRIAQWQPNRRPLIRSASIRSFRRIWARARHCWIALTAARPRFSISATKRRVPLVGLQGREPQKLLEILVKKSKIH